MHRLQRALHQRRDDRGSLTLYFVVVVFGLFLCIGLVVDGGGKVKAAQRADATARQAARSGGQAIAAGTAIRGQGAQVQTGQARAAAQAYLAAAGVSGTVTVTDGTHLQVDTTTSYTPVFLGAIGISRMTGTGHANVRLVQGLR